MRLRAALEHFPIRLTISRIGEECPTFRSGDLAKTRGNGLAQAVDGKGSVLEGISLTLTRIDPGCAHISDPPTSRAPVDRRWASSRRAHSNVALGWPSVARVIVPCKDWPSATAFGGFGLDKGLLPGPRLPPRGRRQRPLARAKPGRRVGPLF